MKAGRRRAPARARGRVAGVREGRVSLGRRGLAGAARVVRRAFLRAAAGGEGGRGGPETSPAPPRPMMRCVVTEGRRGRVERDRSEYPLYDGSYLHDPGAIMASMRPTPTVDKRPSVVLFFSLTAAFIVS